MFVYIFSTHVITLCTRFDNCSSGKVNLGERYPNRVGSFGLNRAFMKIWTLNSCRTDNTWVFSSPEPKARVSYCHSARSVVRPSSVRPLTYHIFDFFSRTAEWILMKLGRDEVLMVPYKCCCFSARSPQGWIQGGAKIGHRGSPSSRNFFFRPEGYSGKLNA